jgi:hypothetical protein
VNEKWGPSVGLFQIRALHYPEQYPVANGDRLRVAEKLRDALYNAKAAYVISKQGTDWSKWSVFTSGKYKSRVGVDYDVLTGHERADQWNLQAPPAPAGARCTSPKFITSEPKGNWSDPARPNWVVNNEVWNGDEAGTQTLNVCSASSWYVVANHPKPGADKHSIKSYPDTQVLFPNTPIGEITSITSTFSHEAPAVGEWNAAYDIWMNDWETELMLWTQHRYGGDRPAPLPPGDAQETATVTIDGQPMKAWRRSNGNYIALVMDPMRPAGSVDLKKVFDWLVSKGWLKNTATLQAVDYGIEIADTAGSEQTFRLNDFTLVTK